MIQLLRVLVSLDSSSVPSSHMVAHDHLELQFYGL